MSTIFEDFDLGKESVRLLKIYPRLLPLLADFTEESLAPIIYSIEVQGVDVDEVERDETPLSKVFAYDDLTDNTFFFDRVTRILYIQTNIPITASNIVTITYVLCFSSFDTIFYLDPEDDTTDEVFYEGRLTSIPSINKGLDSEVSGFIPSYTSSFEISNADGEFNYIMNSEHSLNRSLIEIYLASRPIDSTKIIKIFTGFLNSVSLSDSSIKVGFSDVISLLSRNIPLASGKNKATVESYPDVALSNVNFNIREIFGRKDFVRCLNIEADNAISPKNPLWVICKGRGILDSVNPTVTLEVLASPSPTTTRFYYDIVSSVVLGEFYPNPGDIIFATNLGTGPSDLIVTGIDTGAGYIEYETASSAPVAGRQYSRDRIGNIWAYRNVDGVFVRQNYVGRGLSSTHVLRGALNYNIPDRTVELDITTDSSNLLDNSDNDILVARVYGQQEPRVGDFSRSKNTGSFSKWHHEITYMLRSKLRVPLALFDQDALDEIELTTDLQEDMSFTLPFDFESQNPNGRDLISMMANSVNAQVYTKLDGTFTLKKIIPPETIGAIEVTKDDIISSSFNYDLIYQNLLASISFTHNKEDFSYVSEDRLTFGSSSLTYRESFVDEAIRYGSESTTEKESLCYYLADVIANSTKQKAIYAYPLGMFSLTLPLSFSNIEIGQTFKIDRSILPTFAGLSDEKFIYADVTNISIGQNSVSFQLWDKQGIIKNEGDF